MLEIVKDQLTEFIHKLIKAEVELSFNFIIQELFPKVLEGIVSRVTIQVQGVENIPAWRDGGRDLCKKQCNVCSMPGNLRTTKYT